MSLISHFRCCHYTRVGYFQLKYLRRNENSFGKNKYPELSLLCIAVGFGKSKMKCERKSLFMQEAAVKQDKPDFTALCCHAWAVSSVGVSHLGTTCIVKKPSFWRAFSANVSPVLAWHSWAAQFPRPSMCCADFLTPVANFYFSQLKIICALLYYIVEVHVCLYFASHLQVIMLHRLRMLLYICKIGI